MRVGTNRYNFRVTRVPLLIAVLAFLAPLLSAASCFAEEPLWTGSRVAEARTETLLKALRASD